MQTVDEVLAQRAGTDAVALEYARALTALPTAPLHEHMPHRAILRFVGQRPSLRAQLDPSGNLVVAYGPRYGAPLLVATAHLDHPAFEIADVDAPVAHLRFLGGIATVAVEPGAPVDFHAAEGLATGYGVIETVRAGAGPGLATATARVLEGEARSGGFAQWRLPTGPVTDPLIRGRSCDALAVAAALLVCLDRLDAERPAGVRFWGLFTRAEELRCLGALRAIAHGTVPDATPVIALDCTRPVNDVQLGGGVVLRVGDSRYTYDPALTHAVAGVASEGAARWQRRLSESGWCEAAVFQAAGRHPATSLTLPILNYHNQVADDGSGPGLTLEAVHRDDYLAMVGLLGQLSRGLPREPAGTWLDPLRAEADRRFDAAGTPTLADLG